MSANSENSKEKVEGSVAAEKAANDANKEDEKADLVNEFVLDAEKKSCKRNKKSKLYFSRTKISNCKRS